MEMSDLERALFILKGLKYLGELLSSILKKEVSHAIQCQEDRKNDRKPGVH
jgi:hypothetical protein